MVRLLECMCVGAELAERTHGNRHSETTKDKQEKEKPARGRVGPRMYIKEAMLDF